MHRPHDYVPRGELPVEYTSLTVFHWPRQGHATLWVARVYEDGGEASEKVHAALPIGPFDWRDPMADAIDRFVDETVEMLGWAL